MPMVYGAADDSLAARSGWSALLPELDEEPEPSELSSEPALESEPEAKLESQSEAELESQLEAELEAPPAADQESQPEAAEAGERDKLETDPEKKPPPNS